MKRWVWVAIVVGACSKDGGGTGKERGPCYGNGTCDKGLVCMSDLCVRPPGADCGKVAEKLASYRLGNYAPREERDKEVADLKATCEKERLTEDEGKCILDSTSKYEIASCPRPLLAELTGDQGGCKGIADNLTKMFMTELAQDGSMRAKAERLAPELSAALADSCQNDGWPEATKKCFGSASSVRDLNECEDTFPEGLEDKLEARVEPVLDKLMREMDGSSGAAKPVDVPPPTATATPPAAPPPSATAMQDACKGYTDLVEKYAACSAVPQEARDAARAGLDAMKQSFAQTTNPSADEVAAAKQACELAAAALEDSMKTFACP